MTDKTDSKERDMMELVDAYAEARHIGGCHTYNAKTAEARKAVIAKLAQSGFDASDMATASAQGFRDGVASSQPALPPGWSFVDHGEEISLEGPTGERWRYRESSGSGTDSDFVYRFLRASLAASAGSEPVAPSGWREAIGEIRAGLEDSEPSGYDNSGYRAFAGTVLDAVDDALAQLVTHPSPPEGMAGWWMPIETAPKDGSVILAFYTPRLGKVHSGCYATAMYECGHWCNPDDDEDWYSEPTHWMPLPPPPTTSAGSGKEE